MRGPYGTSTKESVGQWSHILMVNSEELGDGPIYVGPSQRQRGEKKPEQIASHD
jgi:hypothetical protein